MGDNVPYRLTDLRFSYGNGCVLDGFTATLHEGGMVAILGPNGQGKTTLLRVMLGRLRARSGSVELYGRRLEAVPAHERARLVAYLPQEVHAAYPLTVAEVVLMGRYPHMPAFSLESRHDWEVAERCMDRTGVRHLAKRGFMTLSGGEKRRVLVASVLAQEPKVMLLDEPTASLDLHHQYAVMELLAGLRDEGITVLLVTHDVSLAARYCARVWLFTEGRVLADGPPTEVITEDSLHRLFGAGLRVLRDAESGLPIVLPPAPEVAER